MGFSANSPSEDITVKYIKPTDQQSNTDKQSNSDQQSNTDQQSNKVSVLHT